MLPTCTGFVHKHRRIRVCDELTSRGFEFMCIDTHTLASPVRSEQPRAMSYPVKARITARFYCSLKPISRERRISQSTTLWRDQLRNSRLQGSIPYALPKQINTPSRVIDEAQKSTGVEMTHYCHCPTDKQLST